MPFISEIGEAVEAHGEVLVEWRIKDFLSLSEKPDDFYSSPVFFYSDSSWHLIVYPNGQTRNQSAGWIDLYLSRKDSGSPKTLSFTLWIKGGNEVSLRSKFSFSRREFGHLRYLSRADLLQTCKERMPSNVLTVCCKLKSDDSYTVGTSLFNRLTKVSSNLQSILTDRKSADFTLRCNGREWPVHKMILSSRCEYFEIMFRHEWRETSDGEVKFNDIDENALGSVLHFIYTGEVEDLSVSNVSSLYVTAHLFLLKDLKDICIDYFKRNMGTDVVCDALEIAFMYGEENLQEHSMKFFVEYADEILGMEEWNQLKEKDSAFAMRILEKTAAKGAKCHKRIKLIENEIAPQTGPFGFSVRATSQTFSFGSSKR